MAHEVPEGAPVSQSERGNMSSPTSRLCRGITCFLILAASMFVSACTTAGHGTFVASTYTDGGVGEKRQALGPVRVRSCQTRALYVFPVGPAPSTDEAIRLAKRQYEGTEFLADVSIDERAEWKFGYFRQCIEVTGTAY